MTTKSSPPTCPIKSSDVAFDLYHVIDDLCGFLNDLAAVCIAVPVIECLKIVKIEDTEGDRMFGFDPFFEHRSRWQFHQAVGSGGWHPDTFLRVSLSRFPMYKKASERLPISSSVVIFGS